MKYKWQRLTEMVGRIVLRPYMYVPHGKKKIGIKQVRVDVPVVNPLILKWQPD